jgi:hypothetical protein
MSDELTNHDGLRTLTPEEIRRIGALQVKNNRDLSMEQFCDEQRRTYEQLSKEELINLLVERDRGLAAEGRALADGRIQGRILREFVRGVLHMADHSALRSIERDGTKTSLVERLLLAMGAEPADARQLKLHGTTMGRTDDEQDDFAEVQQAMRTSDTTTIKEKL